MHIRVSEARADDFELVSIAVERPQTVVVRTIGRTASELIVGNDAVSLVGQLTVWIAHEVTRQTGAAIDAQQHVVAAAVTVSDYVIPVHRDAFDCVGLTFKHSPLPSQRRKY